MIASGASEENFAIFHFENILFLTCQPIISRCSAPGTFEKKYNDCERSELDFFLIFHFENILFLTFQRPHFTKY